MPVVKKRIIFVDDQPNVLKGFKRMLHPMRDEWEMTFTEGGAEALKIMAEEPFDIIISDMRMPGMDGIQLLTEVKRNYPNMIRIILTGYSDYDITMRSVGVTHQFLFKPCEPDKLKNTIVRACALREILADEKLKEMVSQLESLPSVPSLYTELVGVLSSPEATIEKVAEVISKDVAMTAKVLQIVNSAFFGLGRHISNTTQAVTYLGFETIKALALSIKVFSQFDSAKMKSFSIENLWNHSAVVGSVAKEIAKSRLREKSEIENAFMSGLLHDIGKLLFAMNMSDSYNEAVSRAAEEGRPLEEVEREIFGTTHAELGSYLLGIWGLPDPIVEAVAFHHMPQQCPEQTFIPLTTVHVANGLAHEMLSKDEKLIEAKIDMEYLKRLDLEDWLSDCRNTYKDIEE